MGVAGDDGEEAGRRLRLKEERKRGRRSDEGDGDGDDCGWMIR